jgi:hypothetical protein
MNTQQRTNITTTTTNIHTTNTSATTTTSTPSHVVAPPSAVELEIIKVRYVMWNNTNDMDVKSMFTTQMLITFSYSLSSCSLCSCLFLSVNLLLVFSLPLISLSTLLYNIYQQQGHNYNVSKS